jgi:DNA polymerase I-like protein with 3'-5' exonuclease and polymerase domains
VNEDQRELIEKLVAEREYLWPGRLSSALACTPGRWFNEPLRWRELIDELLEAGDLVQVKVGADPIRFAVSGEPLAPEVSGSPNPPSAEIAQDTPEPTPQPAPPVKRARRSAEEVAAAKAAKDAEREMTKLHREALAMNRVRERELAKAAAKLAREAAAAQAKIDKAQAKADAKLEAYERGIRDAEGELFALPAVVVRMPSGPPRVTTVTDVQAWKVMEMYIDALCVDVEHAGYPLGHKDYEIRTIQLGGEQAAIVFDAQDPRQMQIAALALSMATRLHAHSAIADIIPCVVHGLIGWDEAWGKMHDSVLYAKLIDPKMSGSDANELKQLAHDLLREYAVSPEAEKAKNALFKAMGCLIETTLQTPKDKNGWDRVNRFSETMIRYAGSDVLDLAAVMRVFPPLPVEGSVLDREREFEAICARVGLDGFALDEQHIDLMVVSEEVAKATSQNNVMVLSDGRIPNPKSVDVIKVLPEVLPGIELPMHRKTGKPSADKASLEKLARIDDPLTHHLCKQILDYRHHDTTLGLLLRPLKALCEHGDGRMRPTVYTIEADTGRTSCRRPNGQQFSRQGGVRACVHADPGYLGVDADFQGCEIRVGAALSGDQGLYDAEVSPRCYKCDRDAFLEDPCSCGIKDGELAAHTGLHWLAAHEAFGHDATKEHRYWCKRGIFTRLFGGKPATAADQVYCDVESMDRVFDAFKEIAPVYTAWDQWLRDCFYEGSIVWRDYATGQNYSQSIAGSKTGIYRTYSGRNIYVTAPHAFGNYAIQGTARELLVDGCLKWNRGPWRESALLPIHDEVFTWVKAEQAQEALRFLVECMQTDVLSSPGFDVRIGADPSAPFLAWPDSS